MEVLVGTPLAVLLWLAIVNAGTFLMFGDDKARAQRGDRRRPESNLLFAAFLGGWPGAKLGQRHFRHKTRKQPFGVMLNMVPFVQVILVLLWFGGVV